MALRNVFATNFGVEVTYHRINGIYDYGKNATPLAHIDVESYSSEEAKLSGYQPVEVAQYSFEGESYPFTTDGALRADAYAAIKTLDKFADAIDC